MNKRYALKSKISCLLLMGTSALTVLSFSTVPASAQSSNKLTCSVATRDKSSLTVYRQPDGESINALRFGREVQILDNGQGSGGVSWVRVAGNYKGQYRHWGWVRKRHLDCSNQSQKVSSKKIVTVYGRMSCSLTKNMIRALSRSNIPYIFKNVDKGSGAYEGHQRARQIGLNGYRLPLIYINKGQWIQASPSPSSVIRQFHRD